MLEKEKGLVLGKFSTSQITEACFQMLVRMFENERIAGNFEIH